MKHTLLHWFNALALILVLLINFWFEYLPLNGKTAGQIYKLFPVYFTPAPYVFSIWSLIYVLLIGFIIYLARNRNKQRQLIYQIGPWFILSCVFNCLWLFLWHYMYIKAALIAMAGLLLSLILLYQTVKKENNPLSTWGKWLAQLPFSLYFSWVCITAIINVCVVLNQTRWDRFGTNEENWTAIVLIFALLFAILFGVMTKDLVFALVFIWAFIGIAIINKQTALILHSAALCAIVLTLYATMAAFQNKKVI
jgi:benzodiazapine receptor